MFQQTTEIETQMKLLELFAMVVYLAMFTICAPTWLVVGSIILAIPLSVSNK